MKYFQNRKQFPPLGAGGPSLGNNPPMVRGGGGVIPWGMHKGMGVGGVVLHTWHAKSRKHKVSFSSNLYTKCKLTKIPTH